MSKNARAKKAAVGATPAREGKLVLPPEQSVAFQIRRAHLAFDRLLTGRLSKHEVKSGYYNYLRALWLKDGVTQRDLSDATRVTETTTVALLKGMVADGLVERVRDPNDKRKIVVSLTPEGRSLEPLLLPYAAELNHIATKGLEASEIATAIKVVKMIAANLEEAFEPNE